MQENLLRCATATFLTCTNRGHCENDKARDKIHSEKQGLSEIYFQG